MSGLPSSPRYNLATSSSVSVPDDDVFGPAPTSVISGDLKSRLDESNSPSLEVPLSPSSLSRQIAVAASASVSPSSLRYQLPPAFTGANGLVLPDYIRGHISSVTLPSRLALLGRKGFRVWAALSSYSLGNAILGYAPVWRGMRRPKMELFLLPFTRSKSAAKLALFVRVLFIILAVLLALDTTGAIEVNVGKVWPVGVLCALYTIYRLSFYRRVPDGIIPFCRSMGLPDIEEYMFSYSWKSQPDNIRTLAKAMWETGVGVWIDVVKLVPGEEIRPVLRTTIAKVFRVVIFLSPEYCASPNCCVEAMEAIQDPDKLIVCVMAEVDRTIITFFESLPGITIVYGIPELISLLDNEVTDPHNSKFFEWWRQQKISGSGVPENVVPTAAWINIPKVVVTAQPVIPDKSLYVGGLYLGGDCLSSGFHFTVPWLMIFALAGVGINLADIYYDYTVSATQHQPSDYVWLSLIAACNLAPFISFRNLYETRRDLSSALKPLLASKSMYGGVKVGVVGDNSDPIVRNLKNFIQLVGHTPLEDLSEEERKLQWDIEERLLEEKIKKRENANRERSPQKNISSELMVVPPSPRTPSPLSPTRDGSPFGSSAKHERRITVYVMNSFEMRDKLFGTDDLPFDRRFSLFVWSGEKDPFTKDAIGKRMMRFLVLVAGWDKKLLATNLFSAVGIRVVDALHAD